MEAEGPRRCGRRTQDAGQVSFGRENVLCNSVIYVLIFVSCVREKAFEHPFVREFAVEVLRAASDSELLTFLLQLVQALRYEPFSASPSNRAVDFPLEVIILLQIITIYSPIRLIPVL